MKEPIWISVDLARAIHARQLAEHGGLTGIRHEDGLMGALDRARNHFAYGETDFAILAAAYAHGICSAHPFSDGNKRTALTICVTFLKLNGYDIRAERADVYRTFYGLAAGTVSEKDLIDWIRSHLVGIVSN